jgi:hypothetical protein
MSKAVKTIVSVVAAIAIPFVAPMIASSIGMSAAIGTAVGSATAGSVIGGAITGAALGAAKGAILGEDVGRSALLGGIGGGIYGYAGAPTAAAPTAAPAAAVAGAPPPVYDLTSAGLTPAPGYASSGLSTALSTAPVDYSLGTGSTATGLSGATTGGAGLSMPTTFGGEAALSTAPVDYSLAAGVQSPTFGLNPATAGFGLRAPDPGFFNAGVANALATGTPIDYSLGAYNPPSMGLQAVSVNPVTGGTQVTTGAGTFQSSTPISQYSGGSYVGPTGVAATSAPTTNTSMGPQTKQQMGDAFAQQMADAGVASRPTTFMDALSKVPGEIAAKFSDPKTLADLTLRAAGALAGSAIAGDGLSDEERKLLDAQTEELRTLQQTNAGLFAQRLEQAQNLMGESKYFDPEYFGLQRARRTQLAGAKAKRAGLRGLEGASRAAEARRFDLETARNVGSSFDQGYLTGVQGRLGTMQAGMQMMPTSFPSSSGDYGNLRAAYGAADQRARQTQSNIGNLFGSVTGRGAAGGRG